MPGRLVGIVKSPWLVRVRDILKESNDLVKHTPFAKVVAIVDALTVIMPTLRTVSQGSSFPQHHRVHGGAAGRMGRHYCFGGGIIEFLGVWGQRVLKVSARCQQSDH